MAMENVLGALTEPVDRVFLVIPAKRVRPSHLCVPSSRRGIVV